MGTITINGKKYTFTDEKNVLTIIRKAGIDLRQAHPVLPFRPVNLRCLPPVYGGK